MVTYILYRFKTCSPNEWSYVFPVPEQQSTLCPHPSSILSKHVVLFCGELWASLSDGGVNLLSHLMLDMCTNAAIHKLNTTAYHPECNDKVEHFNQTLKVM